MLQILFMILKILGILLLVILGFILAVLLLVLFVPLRYRVDAAFDGKPEGGVLVSWLLQLITVRVSYDGSVKALVKVLWFRLFDKTVWPTEEEETETDDLPVEAVDPVQTPAVTEPISPAEPIRIAEPEVPLEAPKPEPLAEPVKAETVEEPDIQEEPKQESMAEKIAARIEDAITKISCKYQQICGKVEAGQEKIEQVRTFLADAANRNTIQLLWKQVKKLLCHILPRKISGRVRFGFDDPATTGQILTYVSPFYGFYAKTLELEPVFDEKVIDGELHVKGHIRVASLLWIAIRVFLNKNFRLLLKKVMAMGKK
ncbi:MAG: DUF2953 domain-containing protein [Lachnoclostridium sp.]|nr:DUF2953 domain-containing protein [Lachnoclostridium sp.]